MKHLLLIILITLNFTALKAQNFNGIWSDSSSTSFNNCYAIFAEDGDSIHVTHYLEFNGEPFVEYGSGIIKNDSLIYKVKVVQQIKGWKSAWGIHKLKISADKKSLRGTYTDNLGNTGSLVFKKSFPKNH